MTAEFHSQAAPQPQEQRRPLITPHEFGKMTYIATAMALKTLLYVGRKIREFRTPQTSHGVIPPASNSKIYRSH